MKEVLTLEGDHSTVRWLATSLISPRGQSESGIEGHTINPALADRVGIETKRIPIRFQRSGVFPVEEGCPAEGAPVFGASRIECECCR